MSKKKPKRFKPKHGLRRLNVHDLAIVMLVFAILGTVFLFRGKAVTPSTIAPANPNASSDAKAVLNYLSGLPSRTTHRTISGEFADWNPGNMDAFNTVYANTGHYMGLLGTDYQDWGKVNDNFQSVNNFVTNYWNSGGLVTLSYHSGNPFTGGRFDDRSGVNIPAALAPGTTQHQQWLTYLDKTAAGLQQLKDNGVVVLWRPFHEMNAPNFWWGGLDPSQFQAMWRDMFNYYTNTKGLNNLLWVYSPGQDPTNVDKYYPGDAYVDVNGLDVYYNLDGGCGEIDGYDFYKTLNKPIALSEFGPVNTPYNWTDLLGCIKRGFPDITYAMTWSGSYGLDSPINTGSKAMLDDPWIANREDIAWKSSIPTPTPTGKPNLIVTSLSASPANPKPGDKVNFTITIKNADDATAPTPNGIEHDVSLRIDGAEATWVIDYTPVLNPGDNITLSTTSGSTAGPWTATQGTHTLEAYVDNLGRIAESNEADNSSNIPLTVTAPTPPNQPPTTSLSSPTNGTTVTAPATVNLTASATDTDGSVTKVDFYQGTTLLGSDTSSPYNFTWNNVPAGSYNLTAKATDNSGAVTTSTSVAISVTTAPSPPPPPSPKVGDLNNDGKVNIFDLGIFLNHYGTHTSSGDLNHDNVVNIFDLGIFLSKYGQ